MPHQQARQRDSSQFRQIDLRQDANLEALNRAFQQLFDQRMFSGPDGTITPGEVSIVTDGGTDVWHELRWRWSARDKWKSPRPDGFVLHYERGSHDLPISESGIIVPVPAGSDWRESVSTIPVTHAMHVGASVMSYAVSAFRWGWGGMIYSEPVTSEEWKGVS